MLIFIIIIITIIIVIIIIKKITLWLLVKRLSIVFRKSLEHASRVYKYMYARDPFLNNWPFRNS